MNERTLRSGSVAAAAVLIGGVLIVALPQHSVSIVQLVVVTVAAAAGLYALGANVPHTGWISPFKWRSPFSPGVRPGTAGQASDEMDSIRAKLSGRRQPIENGPAMPPEILRLLKPLIRIAHDLDPDDEAHQPPARGVLSPLTRAILTSDSLNESHWFRTLWSNEREVAEVVHSVMDDLDRLAAGTAGSQQPIDISPPRTT